MAIFERSCLPKSLIDKVCLSVKIYKDYNIKWQKFIQFQFQILEE